MVRGVDAECLASVHRVIKITRGRLFHPPFREVVVGAMMAERYPSLREGGTVKIGKYDWKIVGEFEASGGAWESLVYTDRQVLKTHVKLNRDFSVTGKVASAQARRLIMETLANDHRVALRAVPEREYYADQAQTARQMEILAYMVSIVMAIGAVFGAVNTMYASVAGRVREIGTLRALGFRQSQILWAFLLESIMLALLGGLVGGVLGVVSAGVHFDLPERGIGMLRVSAIPTWELLAYGLGFAVVMGAIGGWFPARAASRLDIIRALRQA